MKFRRQFILKIKERGGAVLIIVALIMVVLIGFAALAVDVGYLYATRNELQNIADGAALAAAGELGNQLSNGETLDIAAIKDVAKEIGEKNQAAGKAIISLGDRVEFGRWKDPALNPNGWNPVENINLESPNAIRVTARRAGTGTNEAVRTFFGAILGIHSVDVSARATAALLSPLQMEPIPVGISKYWFEPEHWPGVFCDQDIKFHPTGGLEGCAGWHTYKSSPANASKLRGILDGLREGKFEIPVTIAGVTKYAFIGGTVASAFSNFEALYESKKGNCGEGEHEGASNWCADVVVYDWDDCSNPNKSITIVGFAPVVITGIYGPPQNTIEARVLCDKVVLADGGGGEYYGELGSIPKLVE